MRQQEVRKQNRLGVLHVRHARHRHIAIGFRLHQERIQHGFQSIVNLCGRIDDEQTEIRGDQFVAAAAGVQFPAERSEFFYQRLFDKVVDVFCASAKFFKPSGIGLGALLSLVKRCERLLHFGRCEDADGLQSSGPCAIDSDFVGQETAIERERALERVELRVGLTLEAPSPQPVVFAFGHRFTRGRSWKMLRGRHFLCRCAACCAPTSTN